ncbi:MAG: hypothetical protein MZU97_03940 [Bacillus subtilis]|nr:hypothetical protein [Bacillus subtilis]
MKKFYSALGQFFGFLTIALYAFLFINAVWSFGLDQNIINLLETIKLYAIFGVCGLAGLEFVAGKKLFAFIYFILLAIVVIFSFLPDVRDMLLGFIPE